MATRKPKVDVVLVGFGWTASILGQELTDAGLQVLALERGGFRDTVPDFATTLIQDELRYAVRNGLFEEPERETLTFRNTLDQTALPMRQLGSFRPASGAGGGGVHWNGQHWRFQPSDFLQRSHIEQRYGRKFIPVCCAGGVVGHKLGEFSATRTFKGHSAKASDTAKAK